MRDHVILVDENDHEIGSAEKIAAHQTGQLHRAFSVFIFNTKGQLLLQKRNQTKYHSGGLWTNTCCSHPRPGEQTEEAAHRRMKEEMGLNCELKKNGEFTYKITFDNGLTEHEYDHIFVGTSETVPTVNPQEAEDWKWIDMNTLRKDLKKNPHLYTYWLSIAIHHIVPV